MKVAAILLVCAITHAKNVDLNENGCPIDSDVEKLYPHEHCNKFYQCTHGELVLHNCTSNLLFNVDKQECDWPEDVDCGNRTIPEPCENEDDNNSDENGSSDNENKCNCNPQEAPSICAKDGSDGTLIAHENCNQFYKCYGGKPVAMKCPENLLYNPYKELCDWPENVDCGDRVIPESCEDDKDNTSTDNGGNSSETDNDNGNNNRTCNCNPQEAPSICAKDGSDGTLIAHENCNQFYKCYNGKPVAMKCPGNLLYNPYKEQCDWPENVECGDRPIPESCEEENDNTSTENGGNSSETDNDNGNNNRTCNCKPQEAPSICAKDGSDGTLIAHENCNEFYKCFDGKPVAMKCPGNLLYNPYKEQCDWPENVECGDRVIPESCEDENDNTSTENGGNSSETDNDNGNNNRTCNCNPQEAPSICAKDESDGTLIAHENCNQFYKCYNGKPVAMKCPGNLLYNPYKEQCDWPENVECGGRPIPESCEDENDNTSTENGGNSSETDSDNGNNNRTCNCNPQEAPSICAKDGSDGTLIAHENCNEFYKCFDGKPVAMKCPGNLLYNPYKEQCDWPEKVECGDRVIPESCEDENDNTSTENGGNSSETDNDNGNNNRTCNCNPQEAPSICAKDKSDGTLIAHENCNQFYKCYNGKPVAMKCPGNLLYNPYKEQCDWPENVDCGDRVIPESCEDDNDNTSTENGGNSSETDNDNGNNNRTCNCNPQEAPSICAKDGSDGTLIAHENCNQFYTCYNGKPVPMECPGNLLYNPYKEQCDWPENVECGDRVIPESCEDDNDNTSTENGGNSSEIDNDNDNNNRTCNCNPQEAPSICAKDGSDGTLIAHENCNQFYKCYNGEPVAMKCPGNLLYNPYKEQCDWPENVECGDRVIPESCEDDNDNTSTENGGNSSETDNDNGNNNRTCNCKPQEAPSICAKDGSDGTLIAHENCNEFYKCFDGKPVAMKCPGNLLYNPYKEQCDWPENVECGDRVIPESCEDENDNTSTENGGNSSETDSDNGNNNRTCNCNPQEAPSICAKDGSDGTLIAHENCNEFYKCFDGKPVAMKCPGNLLYNPYKEQCDWPEKVECGDRVIPESCEDENDNTSTENGGNSSETDNDNGNNNRTCNCNPQEAPSICAKDKSDGTLIAHENCNQFYKCYNGKPVAMKCPGNLLYNPYKEQCDWPENVDCGDRVIPESCEDDNDNTSTENGGNSSETDNDNGNNNRTCNCNPQEAPSICAKDGSDGTLIAHENCNQFYTCYNGKPVPMKCPGNLLYNPYKEQCDWPENVECGDRVIPESCEDDNDNTSTENGGNSSEIDNDNGNNNRTCNCNPQEAPSICAKDGSDGTLIAHENCNQFYKCYNGEPVAMKCPGNLLYNPYKEQCDWPENVECGDRVIPESCEDDNDNTSTENGGNSSETDNDNGNNNRTCNCNPQEAPSICAKDGSDGTLIAHENCNQFYKCYNGKPVAMTCPGNLLYNPYKEQCEWPENVECGDRVIPESCEDDNDNTSTENGGNSSETDNDNGNNNRTCNCNPQEAPSICAKDESDGTLIAHENCNQFYKCYNGKPVAMKCPVKLLYNPYKEQCDWPENVDCGDRVIPESCEDDNDNTSTENGGNSSETDNDNGNNNRTCNCNPQEAPSICAKDGSDGTLIAHENCNQFYTCYNGKPVAMKCPRNLLYNPYKEQCDWPENVECGDRVIPESCEVDNDNTSTENGGNSSETDNDNGNNNRTCNCNPQEAPSICAKDGSDGTLIAHENCNQFYKCYNGKPVAMKCPGNLLYNPYKEQCDWPENVECGDRVIPESCEDENDNTSTENGGNSSETDNDNGNNNRTCNCNPQEAPSICVKDGSDGTLIAHENCNQFYKCFDEKPVAMSCPGNLLYNPYKEQCDWPENVECGDRVIPESCEDENDNTSTENGGNSSETDNDNGNNNRTCNCKPQEAPSICAKDGSDGTLIAHENCNQFYKCFGGKPVAMKCPGNLLYNPYKEQCDWPENVECGDRVIPESCEDENVNSSTESGGNSSETDNDNGNNNRTCNCNPQEAPSICAKDGSDGTLIAHENCNQFYNCFGGKPVAMKCPGNLLYNPYKEQCDWPENVDCGDRVIPESCEDDNDNTSTENGGNSSETDNDNGNNNRTCNCNPQEAPSICAKGGSDGTLIAHENCNQFYKCFDGKPVVLSCPGTLLYNPYTEQCDWLENVECGDRIIPEPCENESDNGTDNGGNGGESENDDGNNNSTCNCNPQEAPAICARDGTNGDLVAHENCNQFYKCFNGKPHSMKCPGKLLYNAHKKQCDWPEKVECGDRIIPEPSENENSTENGGNSDESESENDDGTCNCNPQEAPSICAKDQYNGELVAHENCNQFYQCFNGKPMPLKCPGVLLYNPHRKQCDWPENVKCGDRVVTPPSDSDNSESNEEDISTEIDINNNKTCNCDPDQAKAICAKDRSDDTLIAHEKCNKFYVCSFGMPVAMKCGNNLLYNPYKEICDWPDNVDCGNRVRPESDDNEGDCNCSPRQAPSICARAGSDNTVVAHENCNQYYLCANGNPIAFTCLPSLLYNPYKEQCDWPENVNCGHRLR